MLQCPGACEHGDCSAAGVCTCHQGWSGHTDLYPLDLSPWGGPVLSCPSNVLTLRLLWILALIGFSLLLALCVVCAAEQWETATQLQRGRRLRYRLQHRPFLFFLVIALANAPSIIALCLVKLASPDLSETIGITRAASAAYASFRLVVPANLALHLSSNSDMALASRAFDDQLPHVRRLRSLSTAVIITIVAFGTVSGLFPLVSAFASPHASPELYAACYRLYMGFTLAPFALIAVWSIFIANRLASTMAAIISGRESLARFLGDEDMARSVGALRRTRARTISGLRFFGAYSAFEACVLAAFILVRPLRGYASYMLGLQAVGGSVVGLKLALVYMRFRPRCWLESGLCEGRCAGCLLDLEHDTPSSSRRSLI